MGSGSDELKSEVEGTSEDVRAGGVLGVDLGWQRASPLRAAASAPLPFPACAALTPPRPRVPRSPIRATAPRRSTCRTRETQAQPHGASRSTAERHGSTALFSELRHLCCGTYVVAFMALIMLDLWH